MTDLVYAMKSGIKANPEFAKKGLASYSVNVGLKCGHDCTYCSSGALLRCHKAFKDLGQSPFAGGYSIIDPDIPERIAKDAQRIRNRGVVQICTTVDAWAPAAQKHDLGRRCLEAILAQPGWVVRILTKNAAVAQDFDLVKKHRDRVLVGISLTGTPDKEDAVAAIEPNASPISERMAALKEAHRLGLRTYGMLCPLLPGVANAPSQIAELVQFVQGCGAEEVFCEAVNARGPGLRLTEEALQEKGFTAEAEAVHLIRKREHWSPYVAKLVADVQAAMRKYMGVDKLRYLLYPTGLSEADLAQIKADDSGVVWL
jgi:DNA repair photolyase